MRYWLSFIIVVGLPVVLRLFRVRKNTARIFLGAYIITVLIITLGSRRADIVSHVALNPFHVYNTAFGVIAEGVQKYGWSELGKRLWWYRYQFGNMALNVFLFMPLGYLLPTSIRWFDRWWKVLLTGFCFSLLIETVQLITRLGWFDASDLLHNTLGALIGYWIYCRWLTGLSGALRDAGKTR